MLHSSKIYFLLENLLRWFLMFLQLFSSKHILCCYIIFFKKIRGSISWWVNTASLASQKRSCVHQCQLWQVLMSKGSHSMCATPYELKETCSMQMVNGYLLMTNSTSGPIISASIYSSSLAIQSKQSFSSAGNGIAYLGLAFEFRSQETMVWPKMIAIGAQGKWSVDSQTWYSLNFPFRSSN